MGRTGPEGPGPWGLRAGRPGRYADNAPPPPQGPHPRGARGRKNSQWISALYQPANEKSASKSRTRPTARFRSLSIERTSLHLCVVGYPFRDTFFAPHPPRESSSMSKPSASSATSSKLTQRSLGTPAKAGKSTLTPLQLRQAAIAAGSPSSSRTPPTCHLFVWPPLKQSRWGRHFETPSSWSSTRWLRELPVG